MCLAYAAFAHNSLRAMNMVIRSHVECINNDVKLHLTCYSSLEINITTTTTNNNNNNNNNNRLCKLLISTCTSVISTGSKIRLPGIKIRPMMRTLSKTDSEFS